MTSVRHPCPCCGHLVFAEPPGSYDICPICGWEDDNVQLRWPARGHGANRSSLVDAQRTVQRLGVSDARATARARPARVPIEDGWRPIDLRVDDFEPAGVTDADWPDALCVLYWWRATFWRRRSTST